MTYIADADDKKVKGLYMLVEEEISKKQEFNLLAPHLKIVEKEKELHVKGKSKSYPWPEAKEIIRGRRKL